MEERASLAHSNLERERSHAYQKEMSNRGAEPRTRPPPPSIFRKIAATESPRFQRTSSNDFQIRFADGERLDVSGEAVFFLKDGAVKPASALIGGEDLVFEDAGRKVIRRVRNITRY